MANIIQKQLMKRITESESKYNDLEKKSTSELLHDINTEDKTVPLAVERALSQIEGLVDAVYQKMAAGGRLFYIGAGTSGRLGVVDASECPPTYGGIAASGTTPYVVNGLKKCQTEGIFTGCITCNNDSPMAAVSNCPVEVIVGPEYVTGSTRMKSGTAQKLVLNMLTTSVMIKLGRVQGNRMVDMQLSNDKLRDRGTNMVVDQTGLSYEEAKILLDDTGSVRAAVERFLDSVGS